MALGYHPTLQLIISRGIGQWEAQTITMTTASTSEWEGSDL